MTLVTGAWAPNSTTNQRMRLELDYTVTSTDTTSTVDGKVYVAAGYSFSDANNAFSWSGSLLGSGSANNKSINVATNGRQLIHTFTKAVSRTASAQGMTVAFQLSGVEYVGSAASVSTTVSIPAAGSTPPSSGSGTTVTISRSGGNIKVEFTGGNVQKIEARRREVRGDSSSKWLGWELVGTSTNYVSGTSFPALVGYDWQVAVTRTTPTASGAVSNVLRHYSAAPALTSAAVSRLADNRHEINWGASATSEQPITGYEIQRWTASGGSYVGATTAGAQARKWTDGISLANNRGRWAVRALNSLGAGPWSYTGYAHGTPAAPSTPTVGRSGASDVDLTVRNNARAAQGMDIYGQSLTGSTWSSMAPLTGHTGIMPPPMGTYLGRILSGLDASKQWRFEVRATVSTPTALHATSPRSAVLQLLTPPNAPTPTPPGVVSSATAPTFAWRHNPADGSEQTAAEFEYRPHGVTTWTTLAATTAQQVSLPAPLTPGNYYLRVRTKGAHADFSPWSSMLAFTVVHPPVVTIVSPDQNATIATNRLSVDIAYSDPIASMVRWTRRLLTEAGLVEEASGTGAPTQFTYHTMLEDQTAYWAEIEVTSGTGLRSTTARVDFTTAFKAPVPPILDAAWDPEQGVVRLSLAHIDPEGIDFDPAVAGRVERSDDAGLTWTEAWEISDDEVVDDWSVPTNAAPWYRGIAITALGVEAASEPVQVDTPSQFVWLRALDGQMARVELNLDLDVRLGHASTVEDYGRERPVAHFGRARPVEVGVSGALVAGHGMGVNWSAFLGRHVHYRDPASNAFWARVTEQGFSLPQRSAWLRGISFTAERVTRPRGVAHG